MQEPTTLEVLEGSPPVGTAQDHVVEVDGQRQPGETEGREERKQAGILPESSLPS